MAKASKAKTKIYCKVLFIIVRFGMQLRQKYMQ